MRRVEAVVAIRARRVEAVTVVRVPCWRGEVATAVRVHWCRQGEAGDAVVRVRRSRRGKAAAAVRSFRVLEWKSLSSSAPSRGAYQT